ncbi:hypothetical protein MMC34_007810 [Xylographa carneopallida]|nr:hypothetical protein [Xylographa carneopallida]
MFAEQGDGFRAIDTFWGRSLDLDDILTVLSALTVLHEVLTMEVGGGGAGLFIAVAELFITIAELFITIAELFITVAILALMKAVYR